MTLYKPGTTRRSFVKNIAIGSAACIVGELNTLSSAKGDTLLQGHKLPRTTPESVGIESGAILAFLDAVELKPGGLHSFMLLRHGQVAAEGWWAPYSANYPHMLYSLSKSFTSTAVGFAVTEKLLTVDALVTSYFPADVPVKPDENLAAMRVRDLLSMSTGHDKDATGSTTSAPDGNWVKSFLALPVEHKPGTHFVYNSAATYMLSAIVQKLTGKTVVDYLKSRLFDPLGIEGETWETCPRGINTGGWGLSVKTEDIARFGQCYLQKGMWNGHQVIPEKWVNEATTKHISNGTDPKSDWAQGYCYQFWRCQHDAYRGDGAFGQYCIVMPDKDAVIAITSGLGDMQAVLSAVWEHLLPGMKDAPLPPANALKLKSRLAALSLPPPVGKSSSPIIELIEGHAYKFEANESKLKSVSFSFKGDQCHITVIDDRGEHPNEFSPRAWTKGSALFGSSLTKATNRGLWTDENTFTIRQCFYETPYIDTIACKFEGEKVSIHIKTNVGFGKTEKPVLVGHLE